MHPSPLAVVTGASSGIGRSIAIRLAEAGYRTLLVARRAALLEQLAADLRRHCPSSVLPMDLSETEAIGPRLGESLAALGPPSIVINCAGYGVYAPFEDQPAEVLSRLMRVNHEAPIRIIRAALPGLLATAAAGRPAHVFNICSSSARMGAWGHGGYAASKGAMRSLTETLAAEFSPRGVNFTVVYPGIIDTPYFRLPTMDHLWERVKKRAISPDRVARAVVGHIGRRRLAVYVPAHYRALDLIYALSPNLAGSIVRSQSTPSPGRMRSAAPAGAEGS